MVYTTRDYWVWTKSKNPVIPNHIFNDRPLFFARDDGDNDTSRNNIRTVILKENTKLMIVNTYIYEEEDKMKDKDDEEELVVVVSEIRLICI
jgi:hypothetical protein